VADGAAQSAPWASAGTMGADAGAAGPSFLVDEWDHGQQRLRPAWCRVHELRPAAGDLGFVQATRARHARLLHQVRRQFAALRPEALQHQRRCSDGDEPDFDALVGAAIERRRGQGQDDRVLQRRQRAQREVAAAFLVDLSASTDFVLPTRSTAAVADADAQADDEGDVPLLYGVLPRRAPAVQAPKRRVIDVEKEAIALMCDALQTLGDAFAVYGFSGEGRHRVEFHIAKDFHEPMNGRRWAALAALQPRGATRMGASIRHALHKLARQPARRKLLIIVSDGYPQDRDYGPARGDGTCGREAQETYGLEDTAHALRQAGAAGITSF
jgi:nitric oxide reductase activation protein